MLFSLHSHPHRSDEGPSLGSTDPRSFGKRFWSERLGLGQVIHG